jgi:hypothetical protein
VKSRSFANFPVLDENPSYSVHPVEAEVHEIVITHLENLKITIRGIILSTQWLRFHYGAQSSDIELAKYELF